MKKAWAAMGSEAWATLVSRADSEVAFKASSEVAFEADSVGAVEVAFMADSEVAVVEASMAGSKEGSAGIEEAAGVVSAMATKVTARVNHLRKTVAWAAMRELVLASFRSLRQSPCSDSGRTRCTA